ncbi:MAG: immunoglobulin domain-containing protein [Saprospiraceae bacterium]|nr:immunoglobulin domain-containing protein [Saprospiraceae bacterium]
MKNLNKLHSLTIAIVFLCAISTKAINITVSSDISSNTTWSADTVKVTDDITINKNKTLTISPGTYVEFQGHYKLEVKGQLLAQGTAINKIIFTALNTNTGWSGIRFDRTSTSNDTSKIEYCIISYGKANSGGASDKQGGAIFLNKYSKVLIRNNIISNNYASYYGGAISCSSSSSPLIINNVICNNTSASMGGAIYIDSKSDPDIINNTIVNNSAGFQGGGVLVNSSNCNPKIINCIIWGNTATTYPQIGKSGYATVQYCDIETGFTGTGNINLIPVFISPSSGAGSTYNGLTANWNIQSSSPCINMGQYQSGYYIPDFDIDGDFRFDADTIDMGALEYISSTIVCGNISTNTTWSGNILVNCDVVVDNGKTLTIQAGTKINFLGQHHIDVNGRIVAIGTHTNNIIFTCHNKEVGWYGIVFNSTSSANDTSKIEYCIIKNGKANGTISQNQYGGGIYISSFSKLIIRNNIISNNLSNSEGGGIYCYNSSAKIINNVIVNNTTNSSYGGGIYIDGTSAYTPWIINNTIAYNSSTSRGAGIYRNSTVNPVFRNNIIWGNISSFNNIGKQIYPTSGLNIQYCDIEGGTYSGTGNISSDPLFKNPISMSISNNSGASGDWSLNELSPCKDAGTPSITGLELPALDLKGKSRLFGTAVDMGPYEDKSSITACGTISTNTVWDANKVYITCDVVINNGVTLTITPGTQVIFQGHHYIDVNGALIAQGTPTDSITFTALNTTTGWDGIHFNQVSNLNDSSIFDYCILEYANRTPAQGSFLYGGALSFRYTYKIRVSNSRFSNNQSNGYWANGGAICYNNGGSGIIKNNVFKNNSSKIGGAIKVAGFNGTIKNNLLTGNTATTYGGGIYLSGEIEFYNNKITNNTSSDKGGGVHFGGSDISNLSNNLIANNTAVIGGGIWIGGDVKSNFINNTICNNYASSYGGGLYLENNADPILKNNIIYGDSAGMVAGGSELYLSDVGSDPKIYNCNIKGGKLLFGGLGAGVNYNGVFLNNINTNPLFNSTSSNVGAAYNGLTPNWSLQTGSVCINAGTESITGLGLPDYDLANNDRIYNGRIDMGAFENQDDITASCTISSDTYWDADTIKVTCDVTINNGATLIINPGTYVEIQGQYKIDVQGTINAVGTADEIITFSIKDTTNFSNMSVETGGWKGIQFNSTPLTNDTSKLVYCKIVYGKAKASTTYGRGGALYIYNTSKLLVKNCIISNNRADYNGGGIYIESCNPKIINNVICNNSASGATYTRGGGIYIDDSNPIIANNTITNNYSKSFGGGIHIWASTVAFYNNIIYGNEIAGSSSYGNIYLSSSSSPEFYNNNIEGGITKISGNNYISAYVNNIDDDPEFTSPSTAAGAQHDGVNANWSISTTSPCINNGMANANGLSLPHNDLADNLRIIGDTIDIGAYESQLSLRFITLQPTAQTVCEGTLGNFSVSASITANYQWQKNGNDIPGATNSTLVIPAVALSDSGNYACIISNSYGSISSDTVKLTVRTLPTIASNPSYTSACIGSNTSFSISATGTEPISYQWYNLNGQLSGGTNSTYTINSVTANHASNYFCIASNNCGIAQSNGATLTIKTPPSIISISATHDICENGSYTYSTSATGTAPISYQWYKDNNIIAGATGVSYNISPASITDAGTYYCKATNACSSDSTNQSVLTIKALPQIVSQSSSQTVCENQSVTFNIYAIGATPLTYEWYKGANLISGANNNTFTISSVNSSDAASYYCKVTNSCGNVTSTAMTLNVNTNVSITAQSGSASVCSGSNNLFSITASGTPTPTYQWFNNSSAIAGATNNTYSANTAGNYYCIATNSCGNSTSNTMILTVNTSPGITTQPSISTKCEGQSAQFSINATGTSPISYQWYNGSGAIAGAVNSLYLISPVSLSNAGSYYCIATNACGNAQSNSASLTVNSAPLITSQSSSSTICSGSSTTISVTATGSTPLAYQWYNSTGAIGSANNSTYSASSAEYYYCKVSNSCGIATSNTMVITVNTPPNIITQSSNTTKCEGQSVQFSLAASGTYPINYQWYKGISAISGATSNSYLISPVSLSDAGNYYCKSTNICGSDSTSNINLTVNSPILITYQSGDSSRCVGQSMTFSVQSTGTLPISYQWFNANGAIAGATNNTYSINSVALADAGYYYCVLTNTCGTAQTNYKTLTVHHLPVVNLGNDTTFCDGGNIILSPGFGYNTIWNVGSFNPQLNVTNTGSYWCSVIDQYGCQANSDTINVNVSLPFANEQLCIVGVDSATQKNIIVWEKTPNVSVVSYNIYKESTVTGVFNLIANKDVDSLSTYIDISSNPAAKRERYAITSIDTCSNESALSPVHATMHLAVSPLLGGGWTLNWQGYQGFTVATYRIWRADINLNWTLIDSMAATTLQYNDANGPNHCYYAIEIIKPGLPCNPSSSKANTNFNSSRSNIANTFLQGLSAGFYANPISGNIPLTVQFYDESIGGPSIWQWDFGDGKSDSTKNPVHIYDSLGVFDVSLTTSNANGSSSSTKFGYINVTNVGVSEFVMSSSISVYPNPYNDKTNIAYELYQPANVKVEVYNVVGERISLLVDEKQMTGSYKYQFSAQDLGHSTGLYFLRMQIDDRVFTKKLIEMK